jgi:hypothetical protein
MIRVLGAIIVLSISLTGCSLTASSNDPQPPETVYVPAPESGTNYENQEDLNSELDEIRKSNCKLADELMSLSLDLQWQSFDLRDKTSFGSELSTSDKADLERKANDLTWKSLDLRRQSDQLRKDCLRFGN